MKTYQFPPVFLLNSGFAFLVAVTLASALAGTATPNQQAYVKASNTGRNDTFGYAVSVSGNTMVIGAPAEDSNATGVNGNQTNDFSGDFGAAYVFVRNGTNWSQQAYLKASNSGAADEFGYSVAVSGDTVVVGANQEGSSAVGLNGNQSDNSAFESGASYIFSGLGVGPRLALSPNGGGGYFLRFNGAPEAIYRVQRATNPAGPWNTLVTLTAPVSGFLEFQDISPPSGQAFYRTVQP